MRESTSRWLGGVSTFWLMQPMDQDIYSEWDPVAQSTALLSSGRRGCVDGYTRQCDNELSACSREHSDMAIDSSPSSTPNGQHTSPSHMGKHNME
uniref:Uncharacterized protein n=1 Tax=Sphaerodactylus townsendi TaxID=933632 RepID=A0ACB8G0Y4_9SAUR